MITLYSDQVVDKRNLTWRLQNRGRQNQTKESGERLFPSHRPEWVWDFIQRAVTGPQEKPDREVGT